MAQPQGLDSATIGAFQNFLGLPTSMQWDAGTDAAFFQFQQAKGWGDQYGLRGDMTEWEQLVNALKFNDRSVAVSRGPTNANGAGATPTSTGTSNGPTAAPAPKVEPTVGGRSAQEYLRSTLSEWGLGDLTDWAMGQIKDGYAEMLPQTIRETGQYKTRFKGLLNRRAAGLNVMSESQYIALENDYRYVLKQYGIPNGMYDSQDFLSDLITKDVSPSQLNSRLTMYKDAAYSAPAETRNELRRLYGVTDGELTAFFIDPNAALPLIEKRFATAGVGGASVRGGFGQMDEGTLNRLQELGATSADVGQFAALNDARELYNPLGFGEQESTGPKNQVVGESFSDSEAAISSFGGDQATSNKLRKRAGERAAAYQGGGGFATNAQGAIGLGTGN